MACDQYGSGFFTDALVVALLKQAGTCGRRITAQRPTLRSRPGSPCAVSACPGGAW
jgi:hypothetical protein